MAEDLRPRARQDYVMSNNYNDIKLAETIYIIRWGVDEPTLYQGRKFVAFRAPRPV